MSRCRNYFVLLAFLAAVLAGGFVSGQTVASNLGWYGALAKPAFNPPNWVFAPVWTTLYLMMAVAAWRIAVRTGAFSPQIRVWLCQLALNFAWPFLFFGAHAIGAAMIDLSLMWLWLLFTAVAFWRVDGPAGLLMLPTLLWATFAGVLNAAIWRLNG